MGTVNLCKKLVVLYQDEHLVVIRKPAGMHVHATAFSLGETAVLQVLRDQLGQRVFPVHRLDRPTSGVLLFALTAAAATQIGADFRSHRVRKLYAALVRGWFPLELAADSPVADAQGVERASSTLFCCLAHYELPMPLGGFATVRSSLVLCEPQTGRRHQIRHHLARANYPVIGDTGHGDRHHNHFYQTNFALPHLQLFAIGIGLWHPAHGDWLSVMDGTVVVDGGLLARLSTQTIREFCAMPHQVSQFLLAFPEVNR